jgi:hypothetical protein
MAVKKGRREEEQARHRSPNYPAVGLREAVDRVRSLVAKDGKAGAKLEFAAKHIGFSGAHGTARAVLSALRKFGLTADQNGRIVPTQLAMDILHFPPNHERSITAKKTAATSPFIYQKLLEQLGQSGELPSPESLRAELVTDFGFNPKAVDAFVNDFLDSLAFAGLIDQNQLLLSGGATSQPIVTSENMAREAFSEWPGATVTPLAGAHAAPFSSPAAMNSPGFAALGPPAHQPIPSPAGRSMRELTLPLMDNDIAFLRVPVPLSEDNFEYLMQQIGLLKRGLVARQAPSSQEPLAVASQEITIEMRRKLLGLGYSPSQISQLSASEAWKIMAESEAAVEGVATH